MYVWVEYKPKQALCTNDYCRPSLSCHVRELKVVRTPKSLHETDPHKSPDSESQHAANTLI